MRGGANRGGEAGGVANRGGEGVVANRGGEGGVANRGGEGRGVANRGLGANRLQLKMLVDISFATTNVANNIF